MQQGRGGYSTFSAASASGSFVSAASSIFPPPSSFTSAPSASLPASSSSPFAHPLPVSITGQASSRTAGVSAVNELLVPIDHDDGSVDRASLSSAFASSSAFSSLSGSSSSLSLSSSGSVPHATSFAYSGGGVSAVANRDAAPEDAMKVDS